MAVGATLAGTVTPAAAAPAADGGCDSATYEFCLYTNTGYKGDSVKVRWGAEDYYVYMYNYENMWHNVSSVVNNTGYDLAFSPLDGDVDFKVAPFHHLSSLGQWDNTAEWVSVYK
ncbi:peptidase inhibitor family I36 protein [Streptomyces tendae]